MWGCPGKSAIGRRESPCKGPGAGPCLEIQRNSKAPVWGVQCGWNGQGGREAGAMKAEGKQHTVGHSEKSEEETEAKASQ